MTKLFSLFVIALALTVSAMACTCEIETYEKAFKRSDAVFIGKLTHIGKPVNDEYGSVRIPVTFEVERSWKGPKSGQVDLFTFEKNMCSSFTFEEGTRYLLYVYDKSFVTAECSSSVQMSSGLAQERLKFLDKHRSKSRSRS